MGRKIRSTRKQKGAAKPTAARSKPSAATKNEESGEDWGPVGSAAKKVAKGAVKGAAKEIVKKKK
jgi:hypothetical protein